MKNVLSDAIRKLAAQKAFRWTFHALRQCQDRGISPQIVFSSLAKHAEVIEDYPNDPRGHSCLVLTFENGDPCKPLHIVVGVDSAVIITVYRPDPLEWLEDFKTRRGGAKP